MDKPLFKIAPRVVKTRGVVAEGITDRDIRTLITEHLTLDDLTDEEDREQNRLEIEHGGRVLTSHRVRGKKVWVISDGIDADTKRPYSTTVLLPSEY